MNRRAVGAGTCPHCGIDILWCLLANGRYRSCDPVPVPVASHHPSDVYAYHKRRGCWVDLGSVNGGPPSGLLGHRCREYQRKSDVPPIGSLIPDVVDGLVDGPGRNREETTSW